jgi:hypothetical protein
MQIKESIMKTLQQQDVKKVSGGSGNDGEDDLGDSSYPRGRCQILRPTFAPQSNPMFLPIGPTTDPVNPIDPVESSKPSKPKNPLLGPTTDPVNPVLTD